MFHPHYAAKLLNDFFAIQVRSGCDCAGFKYFFYYYS